MKFFYPLFYIIALSLFDPAVSYGQFQYISPKPGSIYHNPETNIILKNGSKINPASIKPELINISGSASGLHDCRVILSSDQVTILIYPQTPFNLDETVTVAISNGFETVSGPFHSDTTFDFRIHPARDEATTAAMHLAMQHIREEEYGEEVTSTDGEQKPPPVCTFPKVEITSTGNEYAAPVFMRNQRLNDNICFARQIMTNDGDSIYAFFDEFQGIDFKINRNGYLTYFDKGDSSFAMMDSAYNQVKKFYMGNGYPCDEHEFLVYPNGHSFLMSYDPQIVDMSTIVTGGSPDAVVTGLVIQELDENDNVIFQWRSWDYLEITNAVMQICLTCLEIDYVHGNSIEIDTDNNLLVSCRHLSAILKISKATGNIIWQMGGENNQFTFPNESGPTHFYYQHHFRLLEDGSYSLFNNANFQVPQASGAKIYILDQTAKTATLKWSYVHPTVNGYNLFGRAMGSVQILPNKNVLIGWGLLSNTNLAHFPNVSEVDSLGNIVWELRYIDSTLVSYRAFKFDFIRCGIIPDSSLTAIFIGPDTAELTWASSNNASSYILEYKLVSESDWTAVTVGTNSIMLSGLIPQSVYEWRVRSICESFTDSSQFTEVQQFTTISVGIQSAATGKLAISLYPNPALRQTTMRVLLPEAGSLEVVVTNLMGETVFSESLALSAGKHLLPIVLERLPAGMYTVRTSSSTAINVQQLLLE